MDFSSLSASRVGERRYPHKVNEVGLTQFQHRPGKHKGPHKTSKEVFDALLSTTEGEVGDLSQNLIDANISYGELALLTNKDLDLMGCKDVNQQNSLLQFFKLLPRQSISYAQLMQSEEAQLYNNTILSRTSSHLDAMRSALSAANYKLRILPSEDVIVGEKKFASRFVLTALHELQQVTDEIDAQLDEFVKEAKSERSKKNEGRGIAMAFSVLVSAALGTWLGFFLWRSVKNK